MTRAIARTLAYQPLREASNEIRILVIRPSQSFNDPICCRLEHVPLAASSDYVALSYCWGGLDKTVPVRINDTTTCVTPSLADALVVLRMRGYKRVWADAICINQADMEERSRQVLRMAAIYRSASAVLARPGNASRRDADTLLRLIPDVKRLLIFGDKFNPLQLQDTPDGWALRDRALRRIIHRVRTMCDKKPINLFEKILKGRTRRARSHIDSNLQDEQWEVLARLLRCEYWNRVWVIQELAMANRLQVVWGASSFSFSDIALLVVAFDILHSAGLVGGVLPTKACLHVKNLMQFQSLQKQLTALPLLKALRMTSSAKATDERDKVYSLTGLTYDGAIIFPTPSYWLKPEDINLEATLRLIQIKNSLDHLVFRNLPPGSWVIDWFHSRTWSSRAVAYLTGNSRFSTWHAQLTTWAASGSSLPCCKLRDGRLEVKGTVIDTIRDCSATYEERRSMAPPIPGRRERAPVTFDSSEIIYQCFHVTHKGSKKLLNIKDFFAGMRNSLVTPTPGGQSDTFLEWISCSMNSSLIIGGNSLHDWFKSSRYNWLNRVRSKCGNEKNCRHATAMAMRTLKLGMRLGETDQGRIGWFNKYSRPGDKLAIISGCSVPVVLRSGSGKQGYMIVGDSIIPSIMQGETATMIREKSVIRLN